jgi:hypothetical protein
MSFTEEIIHTEPPIASVTVVYLGPVAPHWELRSDFGERSVLEQFSGRVHARLMLLPPHDPQFKRNRERVKRDAERENITLAWDPPELDIDPERPERSERPDRGDRPERGDRGDRGARGDSSPNERH